MSAIGLSTEQHRIEAERNAVIWQRKPILRRVYAEFYREIVKWIDRNKPGRVVEIGSGIGNLREQIPDAIRSDTFWKPWLDVVCNGYALPFSHGSVSHLILFDVFHHLQYPMRFLSEARRVLAPGGRVVLLEPYISTASRMVYKLGHKEPIRWTDSIDFCDELPVGPMPYYAAQGNATRIFFQKERARLEGWTIEHAEAFACFSYFLTRGFSGCSLYPPVLFPLLRGLDRVISRWPMRWAGRCLVVLREGANGTVSCQG